MNNLATWTAATLIGIGLASYAQAGERFIPRDTRILGCIAIVDEVSAGNITPTEWLEANREEFKDLELELKRRKYPPAKAKEMLMGMAISLCMERKGYINKCVADSDNEDADVQAMRTANVYACWTTRRRAENAPSIPDAPPQPPPGPTLPPMSPADLAQFNEDMAIITSPPSGIYPYGNQGERFASCASYWQSLSYNRSPEARQVLYAVRVARCMYRTGFSVQRCPPLDFNAMLQPQCYARF